MEKEKVVTEELTKEQVAGLIKENTELKQQLEGLIKRYKKLSSLYNDAIEKILSE